jgi:hypothetical protein
MLGYCRLRNPSARLTATLRDERRIWLLNEYRSSCGNDFHQLKVSMANLNASL